LVVLFAVCWWRLPHLLYGYPKTEPEARLKAITDTRTALLAGLLGLAAILTFWLNSRGQMTDRYTNAIKQLGSKTLDVRLGGIYALEHIADDSPSYHPTIVEVLSAFTRVHSDPIFRWRQHSAQFGQLEALSAQEECDKAMDHVRDFPLPDDVQAAATVLGRLPPAAGSHVDLREAYLAKVQLKGAKLLGALFDQADLSNAQLQEAHLEGAQLRGACLDGAQLQNARGDSETTWPEGFDPGRAGVALIDHPAHLSEQPER
jgi:hypothetical protein